MGEREEQENVLVGMWKRWQDQTTAKDDEISHNIFRHNMRETQFIFLIKTTHIRKHTIKEPPETDLEFCSL